MPYTNAAGPSYQSTQRQPQDSSISGGQQVTSPPTSIPDANLGLSREEVAALRQHQQLAHQNARSSAGSAASSQGRLLLDPTSLTLLGRHFERVMGAISARLEQLNEATETATEVQQQRIANGIEITDQEIARFRAVMRTIDELENEFDKLRRLAEIVRAFRRRVEELERRLG